ncbi:glyceraldehyde-3-phosphate dehydrogenase [Ruegeria marisrubri]|uniref:Glyceraldehyde-3-phosphate dehydrogenase n=1 Tax=Ruegeria marisrubri TaxID=1685379 RepID=A0A117KHA7_9RHOB|nr:glyceraldehyde-3-phosphate dehydrogenase [Ruegeria marisrubri]KUJ86233.1 glyceraldehyde-3-phosphate dehydrogenase [Ruegeria marisrubri]
MTNRIAIWLGVLILGAILLDYALFGTEHLLFLGKKLYEFLDWLAFWR